MKAVMAEDCATTEIDFISKDNSPFFTDKKYSQKKMHLKNLTWISLAIGLLCFFTFYALSRPYSKISQPIPMAYDWKITMNHVKVLEMAAWRFGSSFLGELISQHPETFYSYEPLHVLNTKVCHIHIFRLQTPLNP